MENEGEKPQDSKDNNTDEHITTGEVVGASKKSLNVITCQVCGMIFYSYAAYSEHFRNSHT
jgi:hypothetical protein